MPIDRMSAAYADLVKDLLSSKTSVLVRRPGYLPVTNLAFVEILRKGITETTGIPCQLVIDEQPSCDPQSRFAASSCPLRLSKEFLSFYWDYHKGVAL